MESYAALSSNLGITCCGQEQMLRTRLGRMTAGLSVATRSDTYIVIAGGYRTGAGSKSLGIFRGMVLEVFLLRNPQIATRRGYRASKVPYISPIN